MENKMENEMETREYIGVIRVIVPLRKIEYVVYGDLILMYPKPCSIYLRGTVISSTAKPSTQNPDFFALCLRSSIGSSLASRTRMGSAGLPALAFG